MTNVAVTERSALIVKVHVVDVPEQVPPDHPANLHPDDAEAVRVTLVPVSYVYVDVSGELRLKMLSDDVTVPPEPTCDTVSTQVFTNVAVTERSALIDTVHVPVPEQPEPDHPEKRHPASAVAVNVTDVPVSYEAVVDPAAFSEMPAGLDDTPPLPV